MQGGYTIAFTERFKKDYKALSTDVQDAVDACILDLEKDPLPAVRRGHRINAGRFPKVFSVDVFSNKSYKISFEINGKEALLRRVGTHREIDRTY
jgi:mRNA-degrading endonuclease YafQ of YafQ-DinJ toxin-antitoxin module